jgi:hypothetical protein
MDGPSQSLGLTVMSTRFGHGSRVDNELRFGLSTCEATDQAKSIPPNMGFGYFGPHYTTDWLQLCFFFEVSLSNCSPNPSQSLLVTSIVIAQTGGAKADWSPNPKLTVSRRC